MLIVSEAVGDVRPALASLTQAIKPLPAFVPMVRVRGVGEEVTDELDKVPSASVFPLRLKLKIGGTVAVTLIWSFVTIAVA